MSTNRLLPPGYLDTQRDGIAECFLTVLSSLAEHVAKGLPPDEIGKLVADTAVELTDMTLALVESCLTTGAQYGAAAVAEANGETRQ